MQTERNPGLRHALLVLLVIVATMGCGDEHTSSIGHLKLDLDRSDPRSFISYYFGGLLSPEGTDPFAAGLVVEESGDYFLDTTVFSKRVSSSGDLRDMNQDGTLDWDELSPFFQATYYGQRNIPLSLDSLGLTTDDDQWFEVSVDGVMTSATRRIRVPQQALRAALENYLSNGRQLIYPVGSIMRADHLVDNETVETTVMRKRGDGYWDYAVFDSTKTRVGSTTTDPKPLAVPTQCVGCHLGSRSYEPEKSFPTAAQPGPTGPRRVHWDNPAPGSALVLYFDEHRKRSDGILGLYGTLFVAEMQTRREQGSLSEDDEHLLESVGL